MPAEHPTEPRWGPVATAARALGVTENAVRRRIRAGTITSREEVVGNRKRTMVRIDAPITAEPDESVVALLRDRVRHLEGEVQWLRQRLEAELARRTWRWPGLRELWRRLWEGGGGVSSPHP